MRTSTVFTGTPAEAEVVAIFCANLAAQRIWIINGTGEQTRDYVYLGVVARANVIAVEGDPTSGAYNIGNAVETSVNDLYRLLHDLLGKDREQRLSSVDSARTSRVSG